MAEITVELFVAAARSCGYRPEVGHPYAHGWQRIMLVDSYTELTYGRGMFQNGEYSHVKWYGTHTTRSIALQNKLQAMLQAPETAKPEPEETGIMNQKHVFHLLQQDMITIGVVFPGSSQGYTYIVHKDTVELGDFVVVDSPSNGYVVAKVARVDADLNIDVTSSLNYKYVVQVICDAEYLERLDQQKAFDGELRKQQRASIRDQALAMFPGAINAMKAIGQDIAVAGNVAVEAPRNEPQLIVDWSQLGSMFKFAAADEDGNVYIHITSPKLGKEDWASGDVRLLEAGQYILREGYDWKKTLVARPEGV